MYRRKETKKAQKVGQQIYKEAFEPFRADGGTQYQCSQRDIDFHSRGKFTRPYKGPFVSAAEATSKIVWHNKETRKVPPVGSAAIDKSIDAILAPKNMDTALTLSSKLSPIWILYSSTADFAEISVSNGRAVSTSDSGRCHPELGYLR